MSFWINNRAWQCLLLLSIVTLYIGIKFQGSSTTTLPPATYTPNSAASNGPSTNGSFVTKPTRSNSDITPPSAPKGGTTPSNDETFNFSVTTALKPSIKDADVHVVKAYKGDDGKRDTVWWEKCKQDTLNTPLSTVECHRKWAGYRETNTIKVNTFIKKQSVLVLIAYEPVIWTVDSQRPELIKKVLLGGYHSQQVKGLPKNVPIEIRTNKPSPTCESCSVRAPIGYASDTNRNGADNKTKLIGKIEQATGLPVITFQSSNSLSSISISEHLSKLKSSITKSKTEIDENKFIDRKYQTAFQVSNIDLPLPAGIWKGLAFQDVQNSNGSDQVLVFYQSYGDMLSSLYAVRIINSEDGTGFPKKRSCKAQLGYISKSSINQNFGVQDCYWLEHSTNPWKQPIFQLSAQRLEERNVKVPDVIINAGFHRADQNMSLTSYHYSNPEVAGIKTQASSWGSSPWHPRKLSNDKKRQEFIREQELTIKSWYSVMKIADLSMQ